MLTFSTSLLKSFKNPNVGAYSVLIMASDMAANLSLLPEIGPDGLPREASVIAYTEKIIEEEQLQLKKYIEENYSKIRDVERELANLTMEVKLTAGPKKAALELLRRKIEMSTERIHAAKQKEEQAKKAWEAASKALKDEEANKQKLCEDLNSLVVQESSNSQFSRLEELKRRLEALNPARSSTSVPTDVKLMGHAQGSTPLGSSSSAPQILEPVDRAPQGTNEKAVTTNGPTQQVPLEGEGRAKKKVHLHGRGKGAGVVPKGRGASSSGWTGAGFEVVDARILRANSSHIAGGAAMTKNKRWGYGESVEAVNDTTLHSRGPKITMR
ncbi:hypothetical protein SAY86_023905 [Trapa natans]|uniref:Uncharacterized protein n=1 Tax=Trapa natans TaxID=22666 RepID=A0AAN7LVP5_TRANT|nr:hypothetical protein SAY86_023905 [Trapa natans]